MDPQATLQAREHYEGREIRLYGANVPQFDGTTSYRQDYPAHPLEGRPTGRGGPGWQANPVPFNGTSSYSSDFTAKPIEPRGPGHVQVYQPTQAPFSGSSTYGESYKPHQFEGRTPMTRPGQLERNPVPFDGTTSYRNDFVQHPMPDKPAAMGAPYQPNSAAFDGSTTYKTNYVPHAFEQRPQHGGQQAGPRASVPFDGSTTYGEYFKPQPILPREQQNRSQYQPNQAKFEGSSESMDAYRAWAIDPNARRGGPPPPMRPSMPFDGTTTNREMFKGWQLPPMRPALGVQMVGDSAYVLIPANAPVPAVGRQFFTTTRNNQQEISILILEGDFTQASRCNVLGQFDLVGLPPGPAGAAKIEVTFAVDQSGVLSVSALDTNTMRQEQWLREGYMHARV